MRPAPPRFDAGRRRDSRDARPRPRRRRVPPMKARRPYLLRAIHEWITDSLCTPAHRRRCRDAAGVEVPRQFVQDGKIVLNVSWTRDGEPAHDQRRRQLQRPLRRQQHVRARADHRGACHLRARNRAGHDFHGRRCPSSAAGLAASRTKAGREAARRQATRSRRHRRMAAPGASSKSSNKRRPCRNAQRRTERKCGPDPRHDRWLAARCRARRSRSRRSGRAACAARVDTAAGDAPPASNGAVSPS